MSRATTSFLGLFGSKWIAVAVIVILFLFFAFFWWWGGGFGGFGPYY
ncbi:hypothetical protein [Paludifilum halophilum]|nr:hypothetical protein [Paludifilum halophilum]